MRVEAEPDVCIGAGNCVLSAPEVFDQDEDGIVQVLQAEVPAGQEDAAREAVERCPARALSLG
ncbi:ferredoxin [uncultured Friedmanniella sp.]|uniref:ferredoxin n=1 Tax=uncultured Friedmanniella sp. TaxID=335381 RepID=UPI0035CA02C7